MEMIDRRSACCFTGHRDIPAGMAEYLSGRVKDGIDYLRSRGTTTFLAGGARGFDALAAMAVIESRAVCGDIRLVLPCRDQARGWTQEDVEIHERIKALADGVICLSERYYPGCMHRRNRYLVDHSSACICYLAHAGGGTAYTAGYAKENGLPVFNLARGRGHPDGRRG